MSVIVKNERPCTILVVDDTPNILKLIKGHLKKVGYHILTAPDAMDALTILEKETPDLIISDVSMPEIDGFEFYKKVKTIPELKNVPFIFLSAGTEMSQIMRGLDTGADDYLTKPIQLKELAAKIEMAIRKSEIKPASQSSEEEISGTLKEKSVAELFGFCEANALTGKLTIQTEDVESVLYYKKGLIVSVEMGDLTDDEALDAILDLTIGTFHITREEMKFDSDETEQTANKVRGPSIAFEDIHPSPKEIEEDVLIDDNEPIETLKNENIWSKIRRIFFS